MLSSHEWYKKVPRDAEANRAYRLKILQECNDVPEMRGEVWHACKNDIFFYMDTFVWQYNPKRHGEEVEPWVCWDYQFECIRLLLDCLECHCRGNKRPHQHDMLWEKSREMGATWLFLIVADWLARFHKNKNIGMMSRNADAVDKPGDKNSLFWKIDFIQAHLPDWLQGHVERRKFSFVYHDTGSGIIGEASTGKGFVGGRASILMFDEFSQIEEASEVRHRTSDSADCRLFNGTHKGQDTEFFKLSHTPEVRKYVMHWTRHPWKREGLYRYDDKRNRIDVLDKSFAFPPEFRFVQSAAPAGGPHPGLRSPWYDDQCQRKGHPTAVAMDLDIDAGGSVAQFFDALTVRELVAEYAQEPCWRGHITYDKETAGDGSLVPHAEGKLFLWAKPDGSTMPSGKFAAGADLSSGRGNTPSVLVIADAETGEKVAEYADCSLYPDRFATVAVAILKLFKDKDGNLPFFCWETPGPGATFGDRVQELGYGNIWYRQLESGNTPRAIADKPGWQSSKQVKKELLEDYRRALYERAYVNRSELALEECLLFRYTPDGGVEHPGEVGIDSQGNPDPSGARSNHGDRTIADALCWKMIKWLSVLRRHRAEPAPDPAPVGSMAWRRLLVRQQNGKPVSWA